MQSNPNLTPAEIERTTAYLRAVARAFVDDARADDLVQGAWLRLYDGRASGVRRLGPFLGGVVRQLARRHGVAERRRAAREVKAARSEAQPSAGELAERLDIARRIAAAIGELPESQRTALLLRYDEGHSAAEIARLLQLPAATVRSRLKRALDALREHFAEEEEHFGSWVGLIGAWALPPASRSPLAGIFLMTSVAKLSVAVGCVAILAAAVAISLGRAQPEPLALPSDLNPTGGMELLAGGEQEIRSTAGDGGPVTALVDPPSSPVERSVHVVLSSASDNVALADYLVEIEDGEGRVVRATTDADGELRFTEALAPGPLTLRGVDHLLLAELDVLNAEDQSIELEGESPYRIQLRVGPTYKFQGWLPSDMTVADFVIDLTPLGPSGIRGHGHAPLREATGLWARFAPGVVHMRGLAPWLLSIRSADGMWAGEAQVTSREGSYPETVALEIGARGRLVGRLESSDGPVIGVPAGVLLESLGTLGHDGKPQRAYSELDQETGTFCLEHLAAGVHTLSFRDDRFESKEEEVTVVPGYTGELVMRVEKLAGLAPIAGTLRANQPFDFDRGMLFLREEGAQIFRYIAYLDPDEAGHEIGFRFDDVPPGEYVLSLDAPGVELIGGEVSVLHGATDLILPVAVVDAAKPTKKGIRVISSLTEEPIPHPDLMLVTEAETRLMRGDANGTVQLELTGQPVEVMLIAEGYRPFWGTDRSLEEAETLIELEPGWGGIAIARKLGTQAGPIGGVRITLDGVVTGESDSQGELRIESDTKPSRIGVDSEVWRLSDSMGGGTETTLEKVRAMGPLLYLYLQPLDRE